MKSILIIDDDLNLLQIYKDLFLPKAYEVDTALDLRNARSLLNKKSYSVILLDILFPGGDGLSLISEIRNSESRNNKAKIVVITNLDSREKVNKAMDLGADKYIFKVQYTPKQIYEEVNKLVDNDILQR